jgi:hypothetical protein
MLRWVRDLNLVYRDEAALHTLDFDAGGFEWIEANDAQRSVLAFLRKGRDGSEIAVVLNLTPTPHENYRIGVPRGGVWKEILNSDAESYGGSGRGNFGAVDASPTPCHGRFHSLNLSLPPLCALFLRGPPPPASAGERTTAESKAKAFETPPPPAGRSGVEPTLQTPSKEGGNTRPSPQKPSKRNGKAETVPEGEQNARKGRG